MPYMDGMGNMVNVHSRSLTARFPLKNGGKGRYHPFLLGPGNFSGASC